MERNCGRNCIWTVNMSRWTNLLSIHLISICPEWNYQIHCWLWSLLFTDTNSFHQAFVIWSSETEATAILIESRFDHINFDIPDKDNTANQYTATDWLLISLFRLCIRFRQIAIVWYNIKTIEYSRVKLENKTKTQQRKKHANLITFHFIWNPDVFN